MKYILTCISLSFILNLDDNGLKWPGEDAIHWMSWEEATLANEQVKKKILVDVYTDWCGWCKIMDRETFSDTVIVRYINEHFYAVKLNAEQKESITWNDREFKWIPAGHNGVHELAYALCDGQMSYPAYIFLTENHERIRISKGFKDARAFLAELKFVAEEQYRKSPEKP